jgi:hypothetical protein
MIVQPVNEDVEVVDPVPKENLLPAYCRIFWELKRHKYLAVSFDFPA